MSSFACAINCMDGRVQGAVKDHMQKVYGVTFVDMVTEPGPNKILAEGTSQPVVQNIKRRVGISVNHHGAKIIAIVAHGDCAGCAESKEKQCDHLRTAKKTVESFGFNAEITLLWVGYDFNAVEIVSDRGPIIV